MKKNILLFCSSILLILTLPGCDWFCKTSTQDRKNNISLLIVDFNSGQTIKSIGNSQIQESPCSTFKIALSLMGFDSGILKDKDNPEWPYKDEYNAALDLWRQPHK